MNDIIFWDRASDFTIKIVMLFTSALALLFFADHYGKMELVWIFLMLMVAMIIKGVTSYVKSKRK